MSVGPRQINDEFDQRIVLSQRLIVRLLSVHIISDFLGQRTIDDVATLEFAELVLGINGSELGQF